MRDIDVRLALRRKEVDDIVRDDPLSRVIEEMGLMQHSVRIDVAIINGRMHGYEIKSKSDTLDRLPLQQELYSKVFDRLTLVVDEHHAIAARGLVPEWWGIIVVSGDKADPQFTIWRRAEENPQVDPYCLCQLLWKEEALELLTSKGAARGLSSKPRKVVWETLSGLMPLDELKDSVRTILRHRPDWRLAPS